MRVVNGSNSTFSYLLSDQLGSTTGILDTAGNVVSTQHYFAYGSSRSGGITQTDKLFTGQQQEPGDVAMGLYNFKARFYSTQLGRFMSADGLVVNDVYNQYVYARNNPVIFTDPTGYDPCDANCIGALQFCAIHVDLCHMIQYCSANPDNPWCGGPPQPSAPDPTPTSVPTSTPTAVPTSTPTQTPQATATPTPTVDVYAPSYCDNPHPECYAAADCRTGRASGQECQQHPANCSIYDSDAYCYGSHDDSAALDSVTEEYYAILWALGKEAAQEYICAQRPCEQLTP